MCSFYCPCDLFLNSNSLSQAASSCTGRCHSLQKAIQHCTSDLFPGIATPSGAQLPCRQVRQMGSVYFTDQTRSFCLAIKVIGLFYGPDWKFMFSCGTKFQAAAASKLVGAHAVSMPVVIVSYPAEETIVVIARRPCIYEEHTFTVPALKVYSNMCCSLRITYQLT